MSRLVVLLTCATILVAATPLAAATEFPPPTAPLIAIAITLDDGVLVTWVPGAEQPDHYAIYGNQGESSILLATALPDETSAQVPPGFPEYQVAAVAGATESRAVIALNVNSGCIRVDGTKTPPEISIGNCRITFDAPPFPADAELGWDIVESESGPEGLNLWANATLLDTRACAWWLHGEDPDAETGDGCEA